MTLSKNPSISIFFPCYNDSGSIKKLVENSFSILRKLTDNYEVVVIDDASSDNSPEILKILTQKHKKLKVIYHEKNMGYGGALKDGFKNSSKELIFYTDGDGQYDVREMPILLTLMSNDVNFINGIKMTRHDPNYRIFLGNLYSFVARWAFWLPVYDVDCDFRLIRKELIDKIKFENNSGAICIELVKKAERAGAKFRQVSVHHLERKWGQSQFFRVDRLLSTFFELSKLWVKLMIISKFFK